MRKLRSHQCLQVIFAAAMTCWMTCFWTVLLRAQVPAGIKNADGLRLLIAAEDTQPALRIVLPEHPDTDRAIEVIFPEHVTARKRGSPEAEHLYLFRPGQQGARPAWPQRGASRRWHHLLQEVARCR